MGVYCDTILVKNAVFYAYHGATQPQIRQGQCFIIDASVTQDMSQACEQDTMAGCLDCGELYQILEEVTTRRRYHLMQTLALAIIEEIKARYPKVKRVTIGACKASCVLYRDCCQVPGGSGIVRDRIGVTLTRDF